MEPRLNSSLLSSEFAPSVSISECVASKPLGALPLDNKVSTYHHLASDHHAPIQSHGPPNTSLFACSTQTSFPDVSSASIACSQNFEAMLDQMTDRLLKGSGYHRSPKQIPPKNIPKDTHKNVGSHKEKVMATPTWISTTQCKHSQAALTPTRWDPAWHKQKIERHMQATQSTPDILPAHHISVAATQIPQDVFVSYIGVNQAQFSMKVPVRFSSGVEKLAHVLVDTGAKI